MYIGMPLIWTSIDGQIPCWMTIFNKLEGCTSWRSGWGHGRCRGRGRPCAWATLNEQVLYDVSSDSRTHGDFAIANGDVGVADVRAAARERSLIKSSVFVKNIAREMARLRRANTRLQQANYEKDNALQYYKVTAELTLVHIYETLFCFVLLICIHSSLCIT